MNYADIAILAFMLISIIIGIIRGFWRTFSKTVTLIISLVLGFMLAAKLAPLIFNADIMAVINDFITPLVTKPAAANGALQVINSEWHVLLAEGAVPIDEALGKMLVPSFLRPAIIASAATITPEQLVAGITLGALVSSAYTHLITMFLAGAIIFIASLIVLRIIAKLIMNAIDNKHFHKALDRILGGALRIVTGGIGVAIILNIISMMSGFDFMAPVMEQVTTGSISGPLFEADLLNKIFYGEGMQKLVDTFKNLIVSMPSGDAGTATALIYSIFI